jgi:hypothetical protein
MTSQPYPALFLLMFALSACATRSAPDFKGRWRAVNHYASSTEEIPLKKSYVFYATPMDATLKTMLSRWADDSKMGLSYLHSSDFTLYGPVAQIQTSDLQAAVSQLTAVYAAEQVSVTASDNQIIVRATRVANNAPASSSATP